MIFYLLHQLFNYFQVDTDNQGNIDHGKRNSKLFLLGTFLWIVVYVLIMNYKMGYFGPTKLYTDALMPAITVMLYADIVVIAYIYKSYFGRSVLWEMDDRSEQTFDYDHDKHKYTKKVSNIDSSSMNNQQENKDAVNENVSENNQV